MENKKRKKFVELAEKRVNKTLKQIQLIGNLANKRNYEYVESDYKKIFRAIDEGVRIMKHRFLEENEKNKNGFKLSK